MWWRPPCLLRGVLVTLVSDSETAFKGVLWRSRGPWLVLRDVSIIKARTAPLLVDGEVVIHRANLAFLQVLP
jgi:hypothetical protein